MTNSDASFSTVPETPENIFNLDCSDMLVPESQSIDEIDQFSEEHGNHSNMHKQPKILIVVMFQIFGMNVNHN